MLFKLITLNKCKINLISTFSCSSHEKICKILKNQKKLKKFINNFVDFLRK